MPQNKNQPNDPNKGKQSPSRGTEETGGPSKQGTGRNPDVGRESREGTSEGGRQGKIEPGKEGGRSQPGRGESGERSASSSSNPGSERGVSEGRSESGLEKETKLGKGREAVETEGLDVDEIDEEDRGI